MDEKKWKEDQSPSDFDLTPPYPADLEEEDIDDGKAHVKTEVLRSPLRDDEPRQNILSREEVLNRSTMSGDPFDLSRPPLPIDGEDGDDEFKSYTNVSEVLAPPLPPPIRREEPRRFPRWVLLSGIGGALLLLLALVLRLLLSSGSTFTMTVIVDPPGSTLYVKDVASGVPDLNGTITVKGLRISEEGHTVKVTHPGYQDAQFVVKSSDGLDQVVNVTLQRTSPQPATSGVEAPPQRTQPAEQPSEISYNGTMILIPAGEFPMGDDNHLPDEKPAHKVNVPAFYIDKYEVTNEQYQKFCDEKHRPYPPNPWWDTQYMKNNPQGPVVGISWSDAAAYAAWAGKRLPTEAEWEKAASWGPGAGEKRLWPWGNTPEDGRANLNLKGKNLKLVAVGQYGSGASAYGVQDMAGNAAEWVDDFYRAYDGNPTSDSNFGTKYRVVRGGSCVSPLDDARTARRLYHPEQYSVQERARGTLLVGFRCAVSVGDPEVQKRLPSRTN